MDAAAEEAPATPRDGGKRGAGEEHGGAPQQRRGGELEVSPGGTRRARVPAERDGRGAVAKARRSNH